MTIELLFILKRGNTEVMHTICQTFEKAFIAGSHLINREIHYRLKNEELLY